MQSLSSAGACMVYRSGWPGAVDPSRSLRKNGGFLSSRVCLHNRSRVGRDRVGRDRLRLTPSGAPRPNGCRRAPGVPHTPRGRPAAPSLGTPPKSPSRSLRKTATTRQSTLRARNPTGGVVTNGTNSATVWAAAPARWTSPRLQVGIAGRSGLVERVPLLATFPIPPSRPGARSAMTARRSPSDATSYRSGGNVAQVRSPAMRKTAEDLRHVRPRRQDPPCEQSE